MEIKKEFCAAESVSLLFPDSGLHSITVHAEDGSEMHHQLCEAARKRSATVIQQFVFGGVQHYPAFEERIGVPIWPLSWLQGDACRSGTLHSMQALAVSGVQAEPIEWNGRTAGYLYEDAFGRHCRLGGIIPDASARTREAQAHSLFETLAALLEQCHMHFTDTVRTWLYLDRLLEWYDEFNTVRTTFFQEQGVFDHLLPASTGIGASNVQGAAVIADLYAIQPRPDTLRIAEVGSPLQNPAPDYRSSFSRAVELESPAHRMMMISGTASIGADGQTRYRDDPDRQIALTMEVVEALLQSRGMHWNDLFRGIVYFKEMRDQERFTRWCREHHIPPFPLAAAHADICRHDLLFEIELDAVKGL